MIVLGAVLSDGFYSGVKGQGKVVIVEVEVVLVLVLLLKYQHVLQLLLLLEGFYSGVKSSSVLESGFECHGLRQHHPHLIIIV